MISLEELTDQRIAGRSGTGLAGSGDVARVIGPHLYNWIRSAVNRIFDFAELVKDTIPIDPVRAWPPGQMLEGVKLQRARGGCLGAKSR